MNKSDFINVLQNKLNNKYFDTIKFNKNDVDNILEAVSEVVTEVISSGDSVKIPNLGTFSVVGKNARTARNPRTQEVIQVPAKKAVKFSVSSTLKDSIK